MQPKTQYMERFIMQDLIAWKNREDRKPLILLGARQVGKTYILKEFGQREFENVAYINCDNNAMAKDLFAFKFQVNKKAQNHISVYLQECVFEPFHILLLEQQYRCGVEYFRSHSVYCIVHQLVELVIMTGLLLRVKLLYLLVVELCPFLCPSEELFIYWFQDR